MDLIGKITEKINRAWLACQPLSALQQQLIQRGGATGICYHAISEAYPGYPFVTSSAAFEAHLTFLAETFEIRLVSDVARALMEGPLPYAARPLAFLCFDDAYRDNLYTATPLLEKFRIPATLFAPRDLVRCGGETHMTEAELKEIAAHPLWELGAHGLTHNVLPAFSPADIRTELSQSHDWLGNLIGTPILGFAYPQGQICPNTIAIAREFYAFAVTTNRRIGTEFDPMQIRRHCPVRQDDPVKALARALLLAPFENQRADRVNQIGGLHPETMR